MTTEHSNHLLTALIEHGNADVRSLGGVQLVSHFLYWQRLHSRRRVSFSSHHRLDFLRTNGAVG